MIDETAFPTHEIVRTTAYGQPLEELGLTGGLTKRELFAAMAMQGMFSGGVIAMHKNDHGYTFAGNKKKASDKRIAQATEAVLYADALIKALEASDE